MREVLAKILEREIQFPDGALITITRVEASPDLHSATVFVTVYPGDEDRKKETMRLLTRVTSFIQRALNRKLHMRPVPKIVFKFDRAEAYRERVEELLSEMHHNEEH